MQAILRKIYAAVALMTVAAILWSGVDLARHFADYQPETSLYAPKIALLRLAQTAVGLFPLLLLAKTLRRERRLLPGRLCGLQPLRRFFLFALSALAATSVAQAADVFASSGMLQRSFFLAVFFLGAEIWIVLCCVFPDDMSRAPIRLWNLVSVNLLLLLALCEGMLSFAEKISDSPLFWDQAAIESSLARYRLKPRQPYFDFRANSLGYHDEEFFVADENDCVVALLADSFGVGVVPYEYNFATVAEGIMRGKWGALHARVAVHNFGVSAIGMHHYAWLLEKEVLRYKPKLVVLCVFVGNDIDGLKKTRTARYALQDWWLWKIPARLVVLGRQETGAEVGTIGLAEAHGGIPEHIRQTEKEKPTFKRDEFLEVEKIRFAQVCGFSREKVRNNYESFFRALAFFKKKLGPRLMVVVIPDEFQVNDSLYAEITAGFPDLSSCDREYPQKRIAEFCRREDIRALDLLPILREAEKGGRTYHLQDTHWNARGNRVAGEALAAFLLEGDFPVHPLQP